MVQVTDSPAAQLDWADWLRRWDFQQALTMAREERFEAMLDAIEATVVAAPEAAEHGDVVVLDLACGPGAISQRLVARFPTVRTFAVDLDPLLLALGQGALGTLGGRTTWLQENLNESSWTERLSAQLGGRQLDAVMSTTALHWLAPGTLARVYRELGQLVRPGGVFLNGDHMMYGPDRPTMRQMALDVRARRREAVQAQGVVEDWERWWQAIAAEPALRTLFEERERVFSWRDRQWVNASLEFQVGALKDAGFCEVDTIWQKLDNRVLMAVR